MRCPHRLVPLGLVLLLAGVGVAGETRKLPADLLFEYADGLYRDGLHKLAVPEFGKFLQQHPNDPRASAAHLELGDCHYQLKDYKAALPHFEAAAADPKLAQYPVALWYVGDCRFRLDNAKGAIEPLRQFLALNLLNPDHRRFVVHAKYTLARAYFLQRSFQEALALFQEVLTDPSPDNTYKAYVLLPIGDCLAALDKPAEALERYEELESYLEAAIKQEGGGEATKKAQQKLLDDLRLKIAGILLGQKQYAEALKRFGLLSDAGPYGEEVLYGRAQCLFYLERFQEALVPALDYLGRYRKGKHVLSALYIAGESCYRAERFEEAEKHLGDFLAQDTEGKHPAREPAAYGRAAAAYRRGKPNAKAAAAAADFFLQHFPQSPHAADLHYFRADEAIWLGDYAVALDQYRKVPAESPYAEDSAHQIAVCLDLTKQVEQAAAAYDAYLARYLDRGKHHRHALERAARLWGQLHQYDKAAERYGAFATRYAQAAPDDAEEFLYRKGACEYETRQYDAMYRTFKAYFDRYPKGDHKGDVLYFLAWYHSIKQQQHDAALNLFELCANIPGRYQVRARYLLAHTHNRLGKKCLEEKRKEDADEHFGKAAETFLGLMHKAPDELAGPAEYVWAAQVFREQGRFAQAIQAYEALIARYPGEASAEIVYWLGELALKLDPPNNDKARQYFTRFLDTEAFKDHPYLIWATFGMAEALKSAKDEKAWDFYQKVEQLAPHVIDNAQRRESLILRCWLQMGRMAYDSKKHEYARDYLFRVALLAGGDEAAEASYKGGMAAAHLDELPRAIPVWQRLLRDHPKSPWREQLLKELPQLKLRVKEDGKTLEALAAAP